MSDVYPFHLEVFDVQESYEAVYQRQKALLAERIEGNIGDSLLLGEHPHVVTLGRGSKAGNILEASGIDLVEIERGGDVTYHGPGQLVGYPIMALPEGRRDLHGYLRDLEQVLSHTLADFGLEGRREPGWTGVWVGEYKIASIGVAVKKWVTYHGFALNVSTDLAYFSKLNPCGLPASVMSNMEVLLGQAVRLDEVKNRFLSLYQSLFYAS